MTQHVAGVSMIIIKIHWPQLGNWRTQERLLPSNSPTEIAKTATIEKSSKPRETQRARRPAMFKPILVKADRAKDSVGFSI